MRARIVQWSKVSGYVTRLTKSISYNWILYIDSVCLTSLPFAREPVCVNLAERMHSDMSQNIPVH